MQLHVLRVPSFDVEFVTGLKIGIFHSKAKLVNTGQKFRDWKAVGRAPSGVILYSSELQEIGFGTV